MAPTQLQSSEHLQSHMASQMQSHPVLSQVLSVASPEPQSPPGTPHKPGEDAHDQPEPDAQPRKRRHVSLYDVVAGRVATKNFRYHSRGEAPTKHLAQPPPEPQHDGRLSHTSRDGRLAPEDALFGRRGARIRHAERDLYSAVDSPSAAHRRLLPDSSLLKALHEYVACFYEAAVQRQGAACFVGSRFVDERSLDDTALLAFGLLLEEAGRDVLGKRGDLVFAEARRPQSPPAEDERERESKRHRSSRKHGQRQKHGKRRKLEVASARP